MYAVEALQIHTHTYLHAYIHIYIHTYMYAVEALQILDQKKAPFKEDRTDDEK
jgi:hypothetical protein